MTASNENPHNTPSYTQQEVQEILQNAIAQKVDHQDHFTYEQLSEMAKELDIPPETLKVAEENWQQQKTELQQRQAFDKHRWKKIKRRWEEYLIVNAFLVTINLITAGTVSWAVFPLAFWGLGLVYDTWETSRLEGEKYDRALEKWQKKKSA